MNKLRAYLGCPLPGRLRRELDADLMKTAWLPVMLVAGGVAVFELVMMAVSLSRPGSLWESQRRATYFLLYLSLFVVTLAAMGLGAFARRARANKPGFFLAVCYVYAILICVWSSLLSAYSHTADADITVFLYVVLCVSFVVPMRPWQALAMLGGNQLLFTALLALFSAPELDLYSSITNSAIASLLGIIISAAMYRGRVRDFVNRITILRQNEEIIDINRQLSQLVYTDELTRAANRRYLEEKMDDKLEHARAAKKSVAVMMLDLDNFKEYNDIYGHQAGDAALRTFAGVAHDYLKSHDGDFIRYGGEEFVLVLYGYDKNAAKKAAELIRTGLAGAAVVHEAAPNGYLTASVGVHVSPPGEDRTLHQMISHADEALYIAKNSGRDRVKML